MSFLLLDPIRTRRKFGGGRAPAGTGIDAAASLAGALLAAVLAAAGPAIAADADPAPVLRCDKAIDSVGKTVSVALGSACYGEIGCDASAFLCSLTGAKVRFGAPCVADPAMGVDGTLRSHLSEIALHAQCKMDSLAWLVGGSRDRLATWIYDFCAGGGDFNPDDPGVAALSNLFGQDLVCPKPVMQEDIP